VNVLNGSNLYCSLNAVSISDDAHLLAGSFSDSIVRLWTLTPRRLCLLKPTAQIQQISLAAGKKYIVLS